MANHYSLEDRLKRAGLRVTAPRLMVLRIVEHEGKHKDADFIASVARKHLGSMSTQTIYNNLNALVAAGLVRRIEPAGHPALYETRVGDNHHHLVCRSCGATADVDCAVGAAPCLEPAGAHGFVVDEAEVIYWGLCGQCHKQTKEE